ncbi:retrovirus-related pol polyprotein from transposon TNT 1-94 [Tanacetum coccineum]|uniref:Retrovirus-related pol polyprotein from transposon TNT 1-94 n=1 Tax=Tanacetum coccineum TaxID=301880 RepID=A0ABQ5DA99_9ASTR
MALGAKLKLGFIDGTCAQPVVTDVNYQRWIRCDYMVTCWVLNSMVTELSNAFLYTQSAQELWKEIAERYGQSNGPLIYRLERELSHILRIEKQKQVTHPSFEPIFFFVNLNGNKATNNGRREFKNNNSSRTEFKKVCTGCNQEGHLIEQCFKRIGYPDWYKGKKGKKGARMAAQVTLDDHMAGDTPFDMGYENGIGVGKNGMFDQKLVAAVYSEVMKMFKGKGVVDEGTANAYHASSSMHYACIFSCFTSAFALLCHPGMDVILDWISDTGASDHMSPHLHLFISVKTLQQPIIVHLPDGRTKIKTPYEKSNGTVPSYSHLRVIGCLCYASVTLPHRDKLEPRGLKYVLLGYPPNSKGYTHYDLSTKKVFQSMDVSFEEKIFPLKNQPATSSSFTGDFPSFHTFEEVVPAPQASQNSEVIEEVVPPEPAMSESIPTTTAPSNSRPTRKSSRNPNQPAWLKDFVTPKSFASSANTTYTTSPSKHPKYLLFTQKDFLNIPDDHIAFLANVFSLTEPFSYHQASKSPEWVQAMQDELNALEKNHTWELTSLPAGHKAISSKWVYKIKYKATMAIDKYKARLVIRATAKGWQLHQLDINNAFLHGFIDEDIYMQPPVGYNGASPG